MDRMTSTIMSLLNISIGSLNITLYVENLAGASPWNLGVGIVCLAVGMVSAPARR